MAVTLTIREVFNSSGAMKELMAVPMPAQTALNLSRLIKKLNTEIETGQEVMDKIRKKYMDPETGKLRDPKTEDEFQKEVDELMASTIEIDHKPIAIGVLGTQNVKLSALVGLDWVFKD